MIIIVTLEEITSGGISETEMECTVFLEGFEALKRTLAEGVRLLSVRVERN
ncbi:hypothetical protein [Specibacter sp. RAF43]|uniref:hypothetical protein n=1 Tax=Specibacter sp. RAF43 TaxID=3233057 RepID=UPI003F9461E8